MVIAFGEFVKADCQACIDGPNYDMHKLNIFSHVLVGTPDCVSNLIARKLLLTKFIKIFVLDDAKIIFSGDFKDEINVVLKFLEEDIQIILSSFPISKDVLDASTHFMRNPVRIIMQKEELTLEGMYNN